MNSKMNHLNLKHTQMLILNVKIFLFVFAIILCTSTSAFSQNLDEKLNGDVAVVSLDLPINTSAEQSVLKALANAGVEPLSPSMLRARLDQAKSKRPTSEVAGKLAKMSSRISKGVEKFFYESEKKSIAYLQPVFDLGMNNMGALARRADYANQIFQAGLLLLRAYEERNKKENAQTIVDLMIRNFPTQPFTTSVIPPKIVSRLETARTRLADSKTSIELVNRYASKECVAYLNGIEAPLNKPIPVAPDTYYHVRLDCGVQNQVVWKTEVKEGTRLSVPLTAGNPLTIGLAANDLNARQAAENALQTILFWADLNHIIGVSENVQNDPSVLLVKIQKGDFARWSDGADTEDIYKALVRLFPELPDEQGGSVSGSANGGTGYLGPILLGSGVVITGIGVGFLFDAITSDYDLNCVKNIAEPSCPNPTNSIAKEDYDKQAETIQTVETLSWIAIGAGTATMIAGGLIWILDGSDDEDTNDKVSLSIDPVGGNYSVGFRTQF